jgi:hypothetical protein
MSRTDKDRPYEVRLRDSHERVVEHHDHVPTYRYCVTGEYEVAERRRRWDTHTGYLSNPPRYDEVVRSRVRRFAVACEATCDLDDSTLPSTLFAHLRWRHCYRSFLYTERWRATSVPRWFRNARWDAPERQRERVDLRNAARSWNAGDDLDDFDFPNHAHRHCAAWDWS